MKRILCFITLFIFSLLNVTIAEAQYMTAMRWYFGNTSNHLVFDANGRGVELQDGQATPFGTGGSLTISEQFSGRLLFYTDGERVYDASHTPIPSLTTPLSGNTSINVPAVGCPIVGNEGQYYVFTNPGDFGVNEIQYSVLDATSVGNGSAQFPLGDIDNSQRNQSTGLTNPSEGMMMLAKGNGTDFWLISQNRDNFDILVTPITAGVIGTPISYNFVNTDNPGFQVASFAYQPDSAFLALAPKTTNRNIWILNFDLSTGILTFNEQILSTGLSDGLAEAIYDVEWSPNGTKLYYSRHGGSVASAQIYQVTFDTLREVNPLLSAPIFRSYGLKKGLDDRIYHLYQETSTSDYQLARLNRPDSLIDSVQYEPLFLNINFDSKQFSEHVDAYGFNFTELDFTWIDDCINNTTKFFPTVEPAPNFLSWDFGDGTSSDAWLPRTQFSAGTFSVTLTAEVNGFRQTVTKSLTIRDTELAVDLGVDTTICIDEILTLDAGMGASYIWGTGETTQQIQVDTAGTYWVEVTEAGGCTAYDEIVVTEYGLEQTIMNQWYFGSRAGIEFTNGPVPIVDANLMDADEGCATISDVHGDLLFYTNGVTVWNRDHQVMENGTSIGGEASVAQGVHIMPFNGDMTMFYIITAESVYGDGQYTLRYSIVDLKANAARGTVVNKANVLMDNSTERVSGSGFEGSIWMFAHQFGDNTFRAFSSTAEGLIGPFYSSTGETHAVESAANATGYMKVSPDRNTCAVNIDNRVEIFDVDINEGAISNPRTINTMETGLYGLEFSNNSSKLYLSTSTKLIQYNLDSLNGMNAIADITNSKFDGYQSGSSYGALQMAPDGVIYMAVDASATLGTISASDQAMAGANFNASGFDLAGRDSRLGLPNFVQTQSTTIMEPSMTISNTCFSQPTEFSAIGRDNSIETYLWVLGDGQSSMDQNLTHTYANAGVYEVTLTLSNRCDDDSVFRQTIEVFNLPVSPSIPTDTVICDQAIVLSAHPTEDANLSYTWSTGETTREITVSGGANITVFITDNTTRCNSDVAEIFVADSRPTIDLGNDLSFCENDEGVTFDASIPFATYSWQIDGIEVGTNRTFDVTTASLGTFVYTLEVENSFSCIGRDTVIVTISSAPDITVTPTSTTGCGNNDGSIEVTFGGVSSYGLTIEGTNSGTTLSQNGDGSTPISFVTLPTDSYTLTVINTLTGCTTTEIVGVEDPGSFSLVATAPDACPGEGDISIAFSTTPINFNLTIIDQNGNEVTNRAITSFANPIATALDIGTYVVTVNDLAAPNCSESETVTIGLSDDFPSFTFDAIQDLCGSPNTLRITDGTGGVASYAWSGPGIIGTMVGTSITVDQSGTYTVTGSGAGLCPVIENIEVILNSDPVVGIDVLGNPCDGNVILDAIVTGGSGLYLYDWGQVQGKQLSASTSATYSVTVTDQQTGCSGIQTISIIIQDNFDVSISVEPDCDNNPEVVLTAEPSNPNLPFSYNWTNASGESLSAERSFTITETGIYHVEMTSSDGLCSVSDSVQLVVVPVDIGLITVLPIGSFCFLDTNTPYLDIDAGDWFSYEWRKSPEVAVISTQRVLRVMEGGTFEVIVNNGSTCAKATTEITNICIPEVFVPSAFSPNGDTRNDSFRVFANDYVDDFEIFIYTRWGELVYHTQDKDFVWNGTYKDLPLGPATYTYRIIFSNTETPEQGVFEKFGSVTIIK